MSVRAERDFLRDLPRCVYSLRHGFVGIAAEKDEDAYIEVELGEDRQCLHWTELQAMFERMEQAVWLI